MNHVVVTAAPGAEAAAVAELQRAAPGSEVVRRLEAGTLLAAVDDPFASLLPVWEAQPPIWVRHVHPVHVSVPLLAGDAGLARLGEAAEPLAGLLDPAQPFAVQSRLVGAGPMPQTRFDINEHLAARLAARSQAPLDVRQPKQVLSLTATAERAYLGLSPVAQNLSAWAGGQIRFAREPDQISRSEFKLLEAMIVFELELPARGAALDLGAAPGGWTRVLHTRGLRVVAVDPADLDPRLADVSGIRHVRVRAQKFNPGVQRFAVITNDMRMDAVEAAHFMNRITGWYQPGGLGILTLKLPEYHFAEVAENALGVLAQAYTLVGARQLFHNRSEITAVVRC